MSTLVTGRPPAVDLQTQKKVFQKYRSEILLTKCKFDKKLYTSISNEFQCRISAKAAHLSLQRHYNEFFPPTESSESDINSMYSEKSKVGQPQRNAVLDNDLSESSSLGSDRSVPSTHSTTAESEVKHILNFNFEVDVYDKKKIQPVYILYRRKESYTNTPYRRRLCLPKYKWADLLRKKIWMCTKILCTLIFLYRLLKNENTVTFYGKCTQCPAKAIMKSSNLSQRIVTFSCKLMNYKPSFIHNPKKKSKLTPYTRRKIANRLENVSATVVKHKIAEELMQNTKECPPILPTSAAMWQIKYECQRSKWYDKNVLMSLIKMSKSREYRHVIRWLTIHPHLCLHYWIPEQFEYYKLCSEKFQRIKITLDATGSIFKKILVTKSFQIKRLFLYICFLTDTTGHKSVPLMQMITNSHTRDTILNWIENWAKLHLVWPYEVIVDDSSALISATVGAFTNFKSTKDYLRISHEVMQGKVGKNSLPQTYIRLDSSHFTKTVQNLQCFKNVENQVKYFYIHCIMFVKSCNNFELIKKTVGKLVKLCLNTKSSCQQEKEELKILIKNIKLNSIESQVDETIDTTNYDNYESKSTPVEWFDDFVENEKNSDGVTDACNENIYFLPILIQTMRRLLLKLPLWSNVMAPFYNSENNSPSSSGAENYFKTIKHLIFKTKTEKRRVDDFILTHVNYLQGELKLAQSKLNTNAVPNKKEFKCAKDFRKMRKKTCNDASKDSPMLSDVPKFVKKWHDEGKENFAPSDKKRKINHNIIISDGDVTKTERKSYNPLQYKDGDVIEKRRKSYKPIFNSSILSDVPTFVENWRGEGKEKSKSNNKRPFVLFLKNGSVDDTRFTIINTCALDSVMFLLANACKYNEIFKTVTEKNTVVSKYLKSLISNNQEHAIDLRNEICQIYFEKKKNVGKELIDCQCNISYIFETICINSFVSGRFHKKCSRADQPDECDNKSSRDTPFLPLNLNRISVFGIECLEDAVEIKPQTTKCHKKQCTGEVKYKYDIEDIITFEYTGNDTYSLSEIPETIMLQDHFYKLLGTIEYLSGAGSLGHYRTHINRGEDEHKWACYDDMSDAIKPSENYKQMIFHALTYIKAD